MRIDADRVPLRRPPVVLLRPDGSRRALEPDDGEVELILPGDPRISPPVILLDRPLPGGV